MKHPITYIAQAVVKMAADRLHRDTIDPHRVGMYSMIPLVGKSVAGSSLNLQDPSKATAGRSLRDLLIMMGGGLGGAISGGLMGAGLGGMAGGALGGNGESAFSTMPLGAVAGSIAGGLGGSYLGGRFAGTLRNEDAVATKDPDIRLHSSLLAALDPYSASSLMTKDPKDVALRGTGGLLGNMALPFLGGAGIHALVHEKSQHG